MRQTLINVKYVEYPIILLENTYTTTKKFVLTEELTKIHLEEGAIVRFKNILLSIGNKEMIEYQIYKGYV